jgi:dUTP pyrophosphatase
MKLTINLLTTTAKVPQYGHFNDSGMDLYYDGDDIVISPAHTTDKAYQLSTGISITLPEGYEAQIRSRSGLAGKKLLSVVNSPGTIDEGYIGEIFVLLMNNGSKDQLIKKGDRIAQMVIAPVVRPESFYINNTDGDTYETGELVLNKIDRKDNGIGSTGES